MEYYINIRRLRLWHRIAEDIDDGRRTNNSFIHTNMLGCGMAPRKIICISPCQRFSALPPLVPPFNFEKMLCENYKYENRYRSRYRNAKIFSGWPYTYTLRTTLTYTLRSSVHFSNMLSLAPANFTAFIPDISQIEKNIAPTCIC